MNYFFIFNLYYIYGYNIFCVYFSEICRIRPLLFSYLLACKVHSQKFKNGRGNNNF